MYAKLKQDSERKVKILNGEVMFLKRKVEKQNLLIKDLQQRIQPMIVSV